ncbi:MAG TPA: alpha-(1-_3)-arabinofuranosyltransferase family protein, partial [Nocardioidaceae bacterium]
MTRLGVWTFIAFGSLLQQPFRTTFDTKFDLTSDPGQFLARSLHLWNPHATFGELQNQAYGYLFPQGPYFLLADWASVPDWLAQRFWTALLLVLAYEGCRGLARAMGLNYPQAVLAGLVYAFSPRLLGGVGVLSGEILPSVLLPWMLWPLVSTLRGRTSVRSGGLRAGCAVFAMSGVNAAGTAALLPAGLILIVWHWRHRYARRLLAWWTGAALLASLWWLIPLALLGRYSPPFLDYIETSGATTFSTSWANSIRGADHWLGYVTLSGVPWWPGAHALFTEPVLVIAAGLVAGLGLWGLAQPSMPLRGVFMTIATLGLLCLVVGSPAATGSWIDGPIRGLLDAGLA